MDDRKNTWCPLIKDCCKGEICVCYLPRQGMGLVEPREFGPACKYFQTELPEEEQPNG